MDAARDESMGDSIGLWERLSQRFSMIPLNGKVPIEKGWERWSFEKRAFDPGDFQGHNAGIACGPASGLLVLDIDDRDLFRRACEEHGWTRPETMAVQTGSGNEHGYFSFPADGRHYGNKARKPWGFDIRGAGGQVVAPGSIHPVTGKPYRIVKDIPPVPPPKWILDLYDEPKAEPAQTPTAFKSFSGDIDDLPIKQETKALIKDGVPAGQRSEAILTVLNALVWAGLSDEDIYTIFEAYPIGEKFREKGEARRRWLEPQIQKARAYVTSFADQQRAEGNSLESGWPEPQPLVSKIDSLPYPTDALPDTIRRAVVEVQAFVKAPVPLVASSALSAVSVAVQAHVNIERAKKLHGPSSLYFLSLFPSGGRKSTLDGFFLTAIRAYEAEQMELAKPILKTFKADKSAWDSKRAGLLDAIKQGTKCGQDTAGLEADLHSLQDREPIPPRIPRLLRGDETPESLAWKLAKEWPAGGIQSSEAGAILGAHGMGADSIMRNLSLLNILWDGGVLSIGRRSTESFTLRDARLTLGLQIQEPTLREFVSKSNGLGRGIGFFARFLVSWPESNMGFRPFTEAPESWPALSAFESQLSEILHIPVSMDENGGLAPCMLTLTPDAKTAWVAFHDAIESELRTGGELYDVQDVASKAADNAARLAALFHTFAHGPGGAVGLGSFEGAARIVAWHLNESRRFFGEIALPDELSSVTQLDEWLLTYCRQNRTSKVSTREVQQFGPGALRNKVPMTAALAELEDLGRARLVRDGKRKIVQVNPALLKGGGR